MSTHYSDCCCVHCTSRCLWSQLRSFWPRLDQLPTFLYCRHRQFAAFCLGESYKNSGIPCFHGLCPPCDGGYSLRCSSAALSPSFIQTWTYISAGGTAPWLPIFSSGLLWYGVGLFLGMNPILATMFRDIRRYGFVVFIWILMFAAMFTIDRIVELYNIQPVLCVLLALLGASLCLYRYFDVNVARENALGSVTHTQGLKAESRRQWRRMGPFTGLFNWIRAGEYENFGFRRVGWPARAAFLPGIAVLGFAACVILLTDDLPGNVMRRQSLGFQRVANMFLTVGPAIYAVAYSINESLFLQKGWLYPQSRTQFARLAYWSGLLYGAVFFWIMLLAFLVRENLMPQYAGYDYIRPLTLILISIPFFQWLRVRYGPLFFPNIYWGCDHLRPVRRFGTELVLA